MHSLSMDFVALSHSCIFQRLITTCYLKGTASIGLVVDYATEESMAPIRYSHAEAAKYIYTVYLFRQHWEIVHGYFTLDCSRDGIHKIKKKCMTMNKRENILTAIPKYFLSTIVPLVLPFSKVLFPVSCCALVATSITLREKERSPGRLTMNVSIINHARSQPFKITSLTGKRHAQ
jgi:hypothetical protein